MANKKKEESNTNTNAWMTTYTDLMTLLLTFFVLLLSLSIIDQERKLKAINSLVGAFGFKPGALSIMGEPKGLNITLGSAPMKKEEISFEQLRNIALKNGLESDLTVIKEQERIVINIDEKVLFDAGSTEIKPKNRAFLTDLSGVLREDGSRIEMRGYAANSEIVFDQDPFKRSMVLSSKRAFAVYQFLAFQEKIPMERMVAHGFGVPNTRAGSLKDMSRNRRQVQIILDYRDRVPYRLKSRKEKGSFLDFKGFFFRFPGDEHG
jgi:chemotaxis protein MotB